MLILALPLWRAYDLAMSASFRDHYDLYTDIMLGPIGLIVPLIVTILFCSTTYAELSARFVSQTRTRESIRPRVTRRMTSRALGAGALFFTYAWVPFVLAFAVWPMLGDPAIDPAGYGLTPAEAAADSLVRDSYSGILQFGDVAFGIAYSLLVGLAAAAFAVLGESFLLIVPHRILAMALPFLIYVGSTVAAAVLGVPYAGLLYSLFPGGLAAIDPLIAATPTFVLFAVVAALAVWVVVRAPRNTLLA